MSTLNRFLIGKFCIDLLHPFRESEILFFHIIDVVGLDVNHRTLIDSFKAFDY